MSGGVFLRGKPMDIMAAWSGYSYCFTIPKKDIHGADFTAWDGSTLFVDGTAGTVAPSKSSTEYIPVYGDGSLYCLQLEEHDIVEFFFRWKNMKMSVGDVTPIASYDYSFSGVGEPFYTSTPGGSGNDSIDSPISLGDVMDGGDPPAPVLSRAVVKSYVKRSGSYQEIESGNEAALACGIVGSESVSVSKTDTPVSGGQSNLAGSDDDISFYYTIMLLGQALGQCSYSIGATLLDFRAWLDPSMFLIAPDGKIWARPPVYYSATVSASSFAASYSKDVHDIRSADSVACVSSANVNVGPFGASVRSELQDSSFWIISSFPVTMAFNRGDISGNLFFLITRYSQTTPDGGATPSFPPSSGIQSDPIPSASASCSGPVGSLVDTSVDPSSLIPSGGITIDPTYFSYGGKYNETTGEMV